MCWRIYLAANFPGGDKFSDQRIILHYTHFQVTGLDKLYEKQELEKKEAEVKK